ncbi:hypothetical protein [Gemmobacter caeruleus]|uniref:hypothetical protein n=1 Tax=Gemmobacter caeruleus TaxID=2595004 RepID=UPI0011EEAE82|nr:hypothetical protein [Gemmobacter caeruleus]
MARLRGNWLPVLMLAGLCATPGAAQDRLGLVAPGAALRIPLDQIVPLSRLRVEIDGVPADAGLALSGGDLLVTLPPGLSGPRHDIVVYRVEPGQDSELGVWSFETPTGSAELVMTGRVEAGLRSGPAGGEAYLTGSGRLGFDRDNGRWRGSLGFLQTQDSTSRNPRTEITDYFLEHRGALWGDDLIARLGTQDLPGETLAMDDGQRRGLSLRLQDPARRSDIAVFALKPGEAEGGRNLTGLEARDDRVAGVAASLLPFAHRGFQIDALAYDGQAEAGPGAVAGQALRLSGPVAGLRAGSFELGYAQSRVSSPAPGGAITRRDSALSGELGFGLLPEDDARSLSVTLGASRIGGDYFSPLNPDLIPDEKAAELGLLWQGAFWQWQVAARQARNNVDALPGLPTDEFRDLSFDLYWLPDDFTGGPLNGMTFYASASREAQRRIDTPSLAAAPEDFDLDTLSFGMDKLQPDYAWALGVTLERLTDLSGRGLDERRTRLEALYAWTPDDRTTLTLSGEAGQTERGGQTYRRQGIEAGFGWDLAPELWSAFVEGGIVRDTDPLSEEGRYLGLELARQLGAQTDLVLRANYGSGAESPDLAPGGGWVVGLGLRHDLGARQ